MAADYRPPITAGTQAAINAEASARAAADTALAGTVTAEAVARANADSAEATARANAITAAITGLALSSDLSAETTARIAADTTLTTAVGLKASSAALASEASSRTSADTALDGRLSTVESSRVVNVKAYGALGDGSTNDQAAILAADAAAAASNKAVYFPPGTYVFHNFAIARDDLTWLSEAATLRTTRTHAEGVIALSVVGNNTVIRGLRFIETNYLATRRDRTVFANGEMIRVGGLQAGPVFKSGATVEDCTIVGGFSGAICAWLTEKVMIRNNRISSAFGNGINAGNNLRDVQVTGNMVKDVTDDGIAFVTDKAVIVSGLCERVICTDNIVEQSDAKGIVFTGVQDGVIANNVIRDTNAYGIAIFEDIAFNLGGVENVLVQGNVIENAGQLYGATRLHDTTTVGGNDAIGGFGNQISIIANTIRNSKARGIGINLATAYAGITIAKNTIQTAEGGGIGVGNVDGSDYTLGKDVLIEGNNIRGTVGGIAVGTVTGLVVTGNAIRSFKSGVAGSYRGIHIGKVKQGRVTGNIIDNDDGAAATILDYNASTPGNNVNVEIRDNLEITAGVRSASYTQEFVTYAASYTPVLALGRIKYITALTGNISIPVPAAGTYVAGTRVKFVFTQDATGGRTVTFGAQYKTASWYVDPSANAVSSIEFEYDAQTGTWLQLSAMPAPIDKAAATASLRTLGTASTQAAAGDHTHTGAPTLAVLAADVGPIASQVTYSDITGLGVAIGASATEMWLVKWWLLVSAANATMDAAFQFAVPASCTMRWGPAGGLASELGGWGVRNTASAAQAMYAAGGTAAVGTPAGVMGVSLIAIVYGGGTAGTVQPRFAQVVSDAGALSILKGSVMEATRVAA